MPSLYENLQFWVAGGVEPRRHEQVRHITDYRHEGKHQNFMPELSNKERAIEIEE